MDLSKSVVELLDTENALRIADDAKSAVIRRTQEITSDFLDNLSDERSAQSAMRAGEFHKAASIPTVIVEKWMAEGFNIFDPNVGLPAILKKLASEDMEHLIATDKRLY